MMYAELSVRTLAHTISHHTSTLQAQQSGFVIHHTLCNMTDQKMDNTVHSSETVLWRYDDYVFRSCLKVAAQRDANTSSAQSTATFYLSHSVYFQVASIVVDATAAT